MKSESASKQLTRAGLELATPDIVRQCSTNSTNSTNSTSRKVLEKFEGSTTAGGHKITNLRYAKGAVLNTVSL